MALTADLTRDEVRTKAMAAIGMTIGATFAVSLVAGPLLQQAIGVPGIFALTGVLALAGIVLIVRLAPDGSVPRRSRCRRRLDGPCAHSRESASSPGSTTASSPCTPC